MKIVYIIIMSCLALAIFFGFALYMAHKAKAAEQENAELSAVQQTLFRLSSFILQYWWGVVALVGSACVIALLGSRGKTKEKEKE